MIFPVCIPYWDSTWELPMGISQAIPDENYSWAFVIGIPYGNSRLEFPMGIGYWISVKEFKMLLLVLQVHYISSTPEIAT